MRFPATLRHQTKIAFGEPKPTLHEAHQPPGQRREVENRGVGEVGCLLQSRDGRKRCGPAGGNDRSLELESRAVHLKTRVQLAVIDGPSADGSCK